MKRLGLFAYYVVCGVKPLRKEQRVSVTKSNVLGWYIATVVIFVTAGGCFGFLGPWMICQKDSLMVAIGVAMYLFGLPVVGFSLWSLVQSIMKATKEEKDEA